MTDNHRLSGAEWMLRGLLLIGLFFLVTHCAGCLRHEPAGITGTPGPVSLGSGLGSVGSNFVTYGLITLGLAIILRLIGPVGLASIFTFGIEFGAISAVVGGAFVWVSEHPWLVGCACLAAAAAWGYYRREFVARWLAHCSRPLRSLRKE